MSAAHLIVNSDDLRRLFDFASRRFLLIFLSITQKINNYSFVRRRSVAVVNLPPSCCSFLGKTTKRSIDSLLYFIFMGTSQWPTHAHLCVQSYIDDWWERLCSICGVSPAASSTNLALFWIVLTLTWYRRLVILLWTLLELLLQPAPGGSIPNICCAELGNRYLRA